MKRLFFYCLLVLISASCSGLTNKPEIIDESFDPEQEELYAQCAELEGLGDLIIGETTYRQAIRSKIYDDSLRSLVENNFYNGHWGVAEHNQADWLEKYGTKIKQVPDMLLRPKIGEIELSDFNLAFYNDKLAAIFYRVERGNLHQHYIEKYGNGRGSFYSFHLDNEPCRNRDRLKSTTTTKEERTWENVNVKLEYHFNYHFEMGPDIDPTHNYQSDGWYLLSSKPLYPLFIEELSRQKEVYEKQQSDRNKKALNQF